jgi:hypothetical protein
MFRRSGKLTFHGLQRCLWPVTGFIGHKQRNAPTRRTKKSPVAGDRGGLQKLPLDPGVVGRMSVEYRVSDLAAFGAEQGEEVRKAS